MYEMKLDLKSRKEIEEALRSKSYMATHETFALFCRDRYGIGKSWAYRLVSGRHKVKEHISVALRWKIWGRDNFTCQLCGSRSHLEVHHKIPESKGGTLDESNLTTLCCSCNRKAWNSIVEIKEWPDVIATTG